MENQNKERKPSSKYFIGLITGFLLAMLILKIIPTLNGTQNPPLLASPINTTLTPSPVNSTAQNNIISDILPEKYDLGISFKDVVVNMVKNGVIDKEKFLSLYAERNTLNPEEKKLLDENSDKNIIVTKDNASVILNLLWPVGIANKTRVLSDGPMGTQYNKDIGNFASTGGWSLGKEDGGKLFNSFSLISLTPEQENEVKEIAQNIFRPCCGNSTYFPDCNHGAAMLGFIELAVSQGLPKNEIYKKALVLNSYWFPQTYAELAVYFKSKKNLPWNKVNPQEVLGEAYSSSQGSKAILPKVQGGGGCGV